MLISGIYTHIVKINRCSAPILPEGYYHCIVLREINKVFGVIGIAVI